MYNKMGTSNVHLINFVHLSHAISLVAKPHKQNWLQNRMWGQKWRKLKRYIQRTTNPTKTEREERERWSCFEKTDN